VPTTKPRHQVTETPGLTHALEVAARRWPGTSTSGLIVALATEGAKVIERDEAERREARRAKLERLAGGFHYEPDYLEKLREDWPE
jgi:hypothetical protein